MNNLLEQLAASMEVQREDFIALMVEQCANKLKLHISRNPRRFPDVARVIGFNGWEYVFLNDGTLQGAFVVAVGPWEADNVIVSPSPTDRRTRTGANFSYQCFNFDAVRISVKEGTEVAPRKNPRPDEEDGPT